MPNFRRWFVPGGTYFFTVVTNGREPLFERAEARTQLGRVLRECRSLWPFRTEAIVLLPDHLHTVWSLPDGDADYSRRWGWIKKEFTKGWIASGQGSRSVSAGRSAEGRLGVWQPRFWEHAIRDEDDYADHLAYVHYNPVRHGYVSRPSEWEWSTFRRWVTAGVYTPDWGTGGPGPRSEAIAASAGE